MSAMERVHCRVPYSSLTLPIAWEHHCTASTHTCLCLSVQYTVHEYHASGHIVQYVAMMVKRVYNKLEHTYYHS